MKEDLFYDNLGKDEKKFVEHIYKTEDKYHNLNSAALDFLAQKLAFEEVIKKESFEIVDDVSKIYPGKIAFLTKNASLVILGRLNGCYRSIHEERITQEDLKLKSDRSCELRHSFELYGKPEIKFMNENEGRTYTPVICLAKTMDFGDYNENSFTQVISDMTNTVRGLKRDPSLIKSKLEDIVIDK